MRKIIVSIILILGLSFGAAITTNAETVKPVETDNVKDNEYRVNWSSVMNSYLVDNGDDTFTRIEYANDKVYIETYNAEGEILSSSSVKKELSLFGGFYSGTQYNFLVFGQNNLEELEDRTVIRVVRYTKDWQRVDAADLKGANTTIPFDAGCLRMVQCGDMLYIRTAHEMYALLGLNHQANLTIVVDTTTMTITEYQPGVQNIQWGYVSHSFNQFIDIDDDAVVAVDHGDAYPRSVVLVRYNGVAGEASISGNRKNIENLDAFPIHETVNWTYNHTGVMVGGFEVSDSSYMIAGNSEKQDSSLGTNNIRNIFVTVTDKELFNEEGTTTKWITSCTKDKEVSSPQLVKINNNKFLLMWTRNDKLQYLFLDGKGNEMSEIYSSDTVANISDCKPIIFNNQVTWYYTDGSIPVFCFIDLDDPETVKVIAEHKYNEEDGDKLLLTKASFTQDGTMGVACERCGDIKEVVFPKVNTPILGTKNFTYDGYGKMLEVTVKDRTGKVLTREKDYYLSYQLGKNVGRYTATVELTGLYTGKKTVYYTVHPKAPASVSAKLYGYNDVKLSWSKCTGATGYNIYRKKTSQSDDKYVLMASTTKTTYSKKDLTGGTRYTFKVVPYFKYSGNKIESINRKTVNIWTLKKIALPKVVKYNSNKIKISWTNISGATGYQISKSTKKTGTNIVGTYKSATLKSKTFAPTKNKIYYYKVRAYKTVDGKKIFGPWSNVVQFKLKK